MPMMIQPNRVSDKDFDRFIDKLSAATDIANSTGAAATKMQAAIIWSDIFEHLFPLPDEDEAETETVKNMGALVPFSMIQPDVHVIARQRSILRRTWEGINEVGPITKQCDITFTITNPEILPANCVVHWMVRNSGDEASYVNDLGHLAGTGLTTTRSSSYNGTHHMDCVIKVLGKAVGYRRIAVKIKGDYMQKRNPPVPLYTKFRNLGRR